MNPEAAAAKAGLCDPHVAYVCQLAHQHEVSWKPVSLLVEHNPLRRSGDAVMALIQGRQLRQHSVIVVRHDGSGLLLGRVRGRCRRVCGRGEVADTILEVKRLGESLCPVLGWVLFENAGDDDL